MAYAALHIAVKRIVQSGQGDSHIRDVMSERVRVISEESEGLVSHG
jgi:hypothetical protein